MIRIGVLALALLVAACAKLPKVSEIQASCQQRYSQFHQVADCFERDARATYARYEDENDWDLLELYIAWLHAAAERVQIGEMSDAEARLGAAELLTRLRSEARARKAAAREDYIARYQAFLGGLAAFNTMTNQPAPRSPNYITCSRVAPGMVTCF